EGSRLSPTPQGRAGRLHPTPRGYVPGPPELPVGFAARPRRPFRPGFALARLRRLVVLALGVPVVRRGAGGRPLPYPGRHGRHLGVAVVPWQLATTSD